MSIYSDALAKYQPRLIKTEAEYKQARARFEQLSHEYDAQPSADLDALVDLCALLLQQYELHASPLPESSPTELLRHLVAEKGLTRSALARELGVSRGQVSNILNGARAISREMAVKLGRYFQLAPSLFLDIN